MMYLEVGVLLILAISGVNCVCPSKSINTTETPSGDISFNFTGVIAGDTCTFTLTLAQDAAVYMTLSELVLPPEASLTFNAAPKQEILKVNTSVENVKVVYSDANQSTVELAVGPKYKEKEDIPITLSYSVEGCEVNLPASKAPFSSPAFLQSTAEGKLTCKYQITQQDSPVGLTFETLDLKNGTLIVSDGTKNATYTAGVTDVADLVAETAIVYVELETKSDQKGFNASYVPVTKDCSEMVELENGKEFPFTSPDYPKDYANSLNCRSVFTAPNAAAILLYVNDAAFGDQFDSVVVNDGDRRLAAPLLVMGQTNTGAGEGLITTSNTLWTSFVSDDAGNSAAGFNITLKPLVFGGALRGNGMFKLKAVPDDKRVDPSATDVYFQFFADPGNQITVSLDDSSLDANTTIAVYDGLSEDKSPMLATFKKDDKFYPVFSSSNAMLIKASGFLENGKLNKTFFNGTFSSGLINPQNEFSVAAEGAYRLVAEKFPAQAVWMIQNPDKDMHVVEVTINELHLANGKNMSSNVTIYSGLAESSAPLATLTPDTPNTGLPKFYVQDGVRVTYTTEGASDAVTEAMVLLTGGYRIISACEASVKAEDVPSAFSVSTPNFPDRYPFNANCKWNYSIPVNKSLHVSFANIDLAQNHSVTVDAEVENEAKNATRKVSYGQYGGKTAPGDLIVKGNDLLMEFSSMSDGNNWTVAQGAMVNIRLLDCGNNVTSGSGEIASPVVSTDDVLCVWIVSVPAAGKAEGSVNILQFDLEIDQPKTGSFQLMLKDGSRADSPDMDVTTKPGKQTKVQSRYNQMYVEFAKAAGEKDPKMSFKITYETYECPKSQQCNNSVCMHDDWKCNGVDDCGDFSDESGCFVTTKKGYTPVAMFGVFLVALLAGIALALLLPPCFRKIRSRTTGEGPGYGNLNEEPVV